MRVVEQTQVFSSLSFLKKSLAFVASLALLFATLPAGVLSAQEQDPSQQQAPPPNAQQPQGPPYTSQTPDQLDQLVAPIALYPDSLVAQILAASTFPEQVVEADRYVQTHPDQKGQALAQAVDQMPWDPSIKALTAFPSVLGNMDKNLSWTSSLGDAYYNQQEDVMEAVQAMRLKAQQSGNLKTTQQQTVSTQGQTIIIQPAQPDVVYVPAYNPWIVYGPPIVAWPGWYPYPGIWYGGPFLSFGVGFGIGWFGGFGWGWHNWGCNWGGHTVIYNHNVYYSHSTTFYNRNVYYRGGHGAPTAFSHGANRPPGSYNGHGGVYNRPGASPRPFEGDHNAARGYAQPHNETSMHSGAFNGYDHGGESRSYSARGASSFHGGGGGGGGFHGGGGGGGGHAGGGHH